MSATETDTATSTSFVTDSQGLTQRQVDERRKAGKVNHLPPTSGRTVGQIIRANVVTRINGILAVLFAIVAYTGSWVNGAFGLLIIANSSIGIIQELRAKRTLDKLSIVGRAKPMVIRDGADAKEIDREEIVVDDLIQVGAGDQIVVDGVARDVAGLEVDESPLTGESEPVFKQAGDEVFSGTYVIAGSATYQATKVGAQAYAAKLAAEASKFTLTDSELFRGINEILRVISWILVPVGALTIYTQLFRAGDDLNDSLLAMVASLAPMVPEGLVLMTSIAFALGVIRLGKKRVLVNELPAIEGLARVDTMCVDKTGTLTENTMYLGSIEVLDDSEALVRRALWTLATLDERPNATARAIATGLRDSGNGEAGDGSANTAATSTDITPFDVASDVAFTSERKWSGFSVADDSSDVAAKDVASSSATSSRAFVLGAPDVLVEENTPALDRALELMASGVRVLVLAETDAQIDQLPHGAHTSAADAAEQGFKLHPLALVVLKETVRSDAADTVRYFGRENVQIKVISGDNAAAVGAVGRQAGIEGAENPVDARKLPMVGTDEFANQVQQGTVFGRVTAEQKREMVTALQKNKHHVAMTGDGVNDVLALKNANIGVAMGSGAPATRSVAQLVLLDDKFAVMPAVVGEGRRVIGNIERVANLFLTKTIYSITLALLVGILGMTYPFQPIHVTITGWFTIGIPAFVLSLAPNHERARSGFVRRVFRLAAPSGFIIGLATFLFWLQVNPGPQADEAVVGEASTATLIVLIVAAFWVLVVVARPYEPWKIALLAVSAAAYVVLFSVPVLAELVKLYPVSNGLLAASLATGAVAAAVIEIVWQIGKRRTSPEQQSEQQSEQHVKQ